MLLLGLGSLSLSPALLSGQQPPAVAVDTAALEFLGFRGGLALGEMQAIATQGGGALTCRRAAQDLRLGECRGGIPNIDVGRSVDLWASLIDDHGAIITLESQLTEARFLRWRDLLEGRYGPATERRQGPMRMLQWVRHGIMLRLSWRAKGRDVEASVSFIAGPLLDAWANQGRAPRTRG